MRRYLLDTSVLAAYLHNRQAAMTLDSPWIRSREVATSILVYGEVTEYLEGRSEPQRRKAQLRELLTEISPYFLTFRIMERYAQIRRQLQPPHGPGLIADVDTLIAATALERKLTLVTSDEDFLRVPDLKTVVVPRADLRR